MLTTAGDVPYGNTILRYANHSISGRSVSDDYEVDVSDEIIVLDDTGDDLSKFLNGNSVIYFEYKSYRR